ncbi:MAG: hypothetical protein ACI9LE_000131 [Paraglaciecola sp.]|jgi:hypothetical protein
MYVDHASDLDRNGKYAIKGVGNASCDKYVKITKSDVPQKLLFAGWINGYMTIQNQHLKDTFDIVSWENIEPLGNYLTLARDKPYRPVTLFSRLHSLNLLTISRYFL